MWAAISIWWRNFRDKLLSYFIVPVWRDIQKKAGPILFAVLSAGVAEAKNGHTAIFAAVKDEALKQGIMLLDYEVGFIANTLQHPQSSKNISALVFPPKD